MEIKLLREKERERTVGLFEGADGSALSDNILSLKNKYTILRKELEDKNERLTRENRELLSKATALEKTVQFLSQNLEEFKVKYKEATEYFEQETEKYRKAINKATFEREDAMQKYTEANNEKDLAKTMAGELRMKNE